jgi:putative colanic acid biosynthesis glycosyltransferase WcaI
MNLLLINRYYSPDISGNSRMLTDLATDLVRSGHRVTVIASDTGTEDPTVRYPTEETADGVEIHRVPVWRFDRRDVRGWVANSLSFYPRALIQSLRLPRPDLIVFMSDPPLVFALGPLLRILKKSRYLCWCQDVYPEIAVRLGILREGGPPHRFLAAVSRRALRSADGVVAVGGCMAETLERKGVVPRRLHIVPNWADSGRIRPVERVVNRFLDDHDLRNRFVVLYSGNMGLGHEFDTIMKAAERLKDRPEIRFLFIGGGKKSEMLRQRSTGLENIAFLPFQDERGLASSLGAGDLHLVTLRPGMEGLVVPSKLYGALAAGRPVAYIGPERSEAARVIREAGCGYVIPPDDDEALCRAVIDLFERPEEHRLLGARARKYFESHHERGIASKRFESVLHEAARSPRPEPWSKRAFDMALSGIGLIAAVPVGAVFAALVKLQDGGPVFYRQERVGRDGRIFHALKFRSMIPNAEAGLGPVQAQYNDPRVTPIGRILRASAMDELPQLWNIFRGDMSFVGPRALRAVETELKGPEVYSKSGIISPISLPYLSYSGINKRYYDGNYNSSGLHANPDPSTDFDRRHIVRPGLTGLAQIYAPRDASRRRKLKYDLVYVRSRSFRLDLKLIALSFWITFRGKWEFQGKKA